MMDFTVGTRDLRQALKAVTPHISSGKNSIPEFERIRVWVDADIAMFAATDRFTIGLGIVSVLEHHGGDDTGPVLGVFDLLPEDAKKVLALFKGGNDPDDDAPTYVLRIDLARDTDRMTFTDDSGLIPGDVLTLTRGPVDEVFPDVRQLIANWIDTPPDYLEGFAVQGEMIVRFKAAASSYGQPLQMGAHAGTSAMVVRCGESFIGAVMPGRATEDVELKRKEWAEGWVNRLPAPNHLVRADARLFRKDLDDTGDNPSDETEGGDTDA